MLNDLDPALCRIMKKNFMQEYIDHTYALVMERKRLKIESLRAKGNKEVVLYNTHSKYVDLEKNDVSKYIIKECTWDKFKDEGNPHIHKAETTVN